MSERLLVVQGTAFNWPAPDHFRVVTLPALPDIEDAMARIHRFISSRSVNNLSVRRVANNARDLWPVF